MKKQQASKGYENFDPGRQKQKHRFPFLYFLDIETIYSYAAVYFVGNTETSTSGTTTNMKRTYVYYNVSTGKIDRNVMARHAPSGDSNNT